MRVGEKLYPGRTMPEGLAVIGGAGWLILLCVDAPTPEEVRAVTRGKVELAIATGGEGRVMLWMLRAPGFGWSAAAFAPWERSATEREHAGRQVVQVALVDGRDTTVRAFRTVGLSPAVAVALTALDASTASLPRSDALLAIEREWTLTASPEAIQAMAETAPVRTFVDPK